MILLDPTEAQDMLAALETRIAALNSLRDLRREPEVVVHTEAEISRCLALKGRIETALRDWDGSALAYCKLTFATAETAEQQHPDTEAFAKVRQLMDEEMME